MKDYEEVKVYEDQLLTMAADITVVDRINHPSFLRRLFGNRQVKLVDVRVVQVHDGIWKVEQLVSRIGLFNPAKRSERWEWARNTGSQHDGVAVEYDKLAMALQRAAYIAIQNGLKMRKVEYDIRRPPLRV